MSERSNPSLTTPDRARRLNGRGRALGGIAFGALMIAGAAKASVEFNANNKDVTSQSMAPTAVVDNSKWPIDNKSSEEIGYVVSDVSAGDIEDPVPAIASVEPTDEAVVPVAELSSGLLPGEKDRFVESEEQEAQTEAILVASSANSEPPEPTIAPVDRSAEVGESDSVVAEDEPAIVMREQTPESSESSYVYTKEDLVAGAYIQPGEEVTRAFGAILEQAGYVDASPDQLLAMIEALVADPSIGSSAVFEGLTLEYDSASGGYYAGNEGTIEVHLTQSAVEWVWNTIAEQK